MLAISDDEEAITICFHSVSNALFLLNLICFFFKHDSINDENDFLS